MKLSELRKQRKISISPPAKTGSGGYRGSIDSSIIGEIDVSSIDSIRATGLDDVLEVDEGVGKESKESDVQ